VSRGADFLAALKENPEGFLRFIRDELGVKTRMEGPWGDWDIEEEIALSTFNTPETRHILVRAGNATSKSHNGGVVGNAWLFCHQPSKIIYLSTKREQAKAIVWAEFTSLYRKIHGWCREKGIKFPDPLTEKVDFGPEWWARVYAGQVRGEKSKTTGWSGFHAKHLLFIIDEALGIPNNVWEMVTACATSKHNAILAQGNPITRGTDGYDWWYKAQQGTDRSDFPKSRKVFAVSSKTSPNYLLGKWAHEYFDKHGEWPEHDHIIIDKATGEADIEELIPGLAGYEWIAEQIEVDPETKAGTPYHYGHILGEFPMGTEWGLIDWADIQYAADRRKGWVDCIKALGFSSWRSLLESHGLSAAISEIEKYANNREIPIMLPDLNRLAVGVDVADGGGNLSAITVKAGGKTLEIRTFDGKGTIVVPPEVDKCLKQYKISSVGIDKPGVGAGPAAILKEMGYDVQEFYGGISSDSVDKRHEYANLNAEMAWAVRDEFSNREIEIPDDEDLKNQIGSIQWKYTEGTRVKVPKPSKSPDKFDSLRIAVWMQRFGDYSPDVVGDQLANQSGQFGPRFDFGKHNLEEW